ncbi:MAG: 6-carboxytetrahydropterin synthase QueD [Geobacteraceae bacterium]
MYELKITSNFSSAHNLMHYQGDCENLHGHNWKVDVSVTAQNLNKAGLGIDFKTLKAETKTLLKTLDHKYLNELDPFKDVSPSSENIARYIYQELSRMLNNDNIKVESITVWESDIACAKYYE